jgi:hypothetical protein
MVLIIKYSASMVVTLMVALAIIGVVGCLTAAFFIGRYARLRWKEEQMCGAQTTPKPRIFWFDRAVMDVVGVVNLRLAGWVTATVVGIWLFIEIGFKPG